MGFLYGGYINTKKLSKKDIDSLLSFFKLINYKVINNTQKTHFLMFCLNGKASFENTVHINHNKYDKVYYDINLFKDVIAISDTTDLHQLFQFNGKIYRCNCMSYIDCWGDFEAYEDIPRKLTADEVEECYMKNITIHETN